MLMRDFIALFFINGLIGLISLMNRQEYSNELSEKRNVEWKNLLYSDAPAIVVKCNANASNKVTHTSGRKPTSKKSVIDSDV
ncbi:Dipeptidyl aminopeptidase-like protein [Dirofilaria immitis]